MEDLRRYKLRGSRDCPIDVYTTAQVRQNRNFVHWHPELEIMFVEEGTTVYRLGDEGQVINLYPEDILIIPPNTLHGQYAYTKRITTRSMVIDPEGITLPPSHIFQTEFVEPLKQGRLIMPTLLHPGDEAHRVLFPLMQQLQKCWIYTDNYKINRFAAAMSICTALSSFCRVVDRPVIPQLPFPPAVRVCMDYIQRNYAQRLTLESLGEAAQLHPNYLCALFKEHTGQTVVEYITKVRVNAAAKLLRDSELPINKVAEQCGFRSESLLYKYFKAAMGMTPKAYRKQP